MIAMIFLYMFFVVETWEMVQYKLEVSPLLIPSQVDWEMYLWSPTLNLTSFKSKASHGGDLVTVFFHRGKDIKRNG